MIAYTEKAMAHRFDPRTKLVLALCIVILSFVLQDPAYLLLLLLLTMTVTGKKFKKVKRTMKKFLPFLFLLLTVQVLFHQSTLLAIYMLPFSILLAGGMSFLIFNGVIAALQVVLRFLTVAVTLISFTATTDPDGLILSLIKLKVPFELALMLNIALHSIPQVLRDLETIKLSLEVRGVRFNIKNPIKKFSLLAGLLPPLIISSILKAQEFALAIEVRAFRANERRTYLAEVVMKKKDYLTVVASVTLTVIAAYLTITNPFLSSPTLFIINRLVN
nr:energy-coupling factor transporter transmembrane protein EcfT [Candidatus Bathyarchaeota archaeon]